MGNFSLVNQGEIPEKENKQNMVEHKLVVFVQDYRSFDRYSCNFKFYFTNKANSHTSEIYIIQ